MACSVAGRSGVVPANIDRGAVMRVLVCGGRDFTNFAKVCEVLDALPITELIEGGAPGADYAAHLWAKRNLVPIKTYEANWEQHGRAAGPIRNKEMLTDGKPDMVVAFPGGRGTANMVQQAQDAGVTVLDVSTSK